VNWKNYPSYIILNITTDMNSNLLMLSWVVGYFPSPQYQALLCSSGSVGYSALKRSLDPGYPEHTILLTNVDVRDIPADANPELEVLPPRGPPYSCIACIEKEVVVKKAVTPPFVFGGLGAFNSAPSTGGVFGSSGGGFGGLFQAPLTISNFGGFAATPSAGGFGEFNHTLSGGGIFGGFASSAAATGGFGGFASTATTSTTPNPLFQTNNDVKSDSNDDKDDDDDDGEEGCVYRTSLSIQIRMQGCTYMAPEGTVRTLPIHFLANYGTLTTIDLSGMMGVKYMQYGALSGCTSLTTIHLTGLDHVATLPNAFLAGCSNLKSLSCEGLGSVTRLPNAFLEGCRGLTSIDFRGIGNVTSLPPSFLSDCIRLTSIHKVFWYLSDGGVGF
jgi:hypothetical protein